MLIGSDGSGKGTMADGVLPAQIRAARAMLDWSRVDLAKAASVSVSVVMRAEGGDAGKVPEGLLGAIRVAAETAGVSFFEDDRGVGVRLTSK